MIKNDHQSARPRETIAKHIISFTWMILLTAIAFVLVSMKSLPIPTILTLILGLAFLQALLQFITFMHLDRRSQIPILFLTSGIGFSIIIALGLWLMVGKG